MGARGFEHTSRKVEQQLALARCGDQLDDARKPVLLDKLHQQLPLLHQRIRVSRCLRTHSFQTIDLGRRGLVQSERPHRIDV